MKVEFSTAAEFELNQAVDYYNDQLHGLGYEFAAEVEEAQKLIKGHPQAWTPLSPKWRRCRTKRFPYGLVYNIHNNKILIVAVMHLASDPTKWQDMQI